MFDVNVEDLLETIDRQVADLLNRYSMVQPPVDAVQLVQDAFDMTIREAEAMMRETPYPTCIAVEPILGRLVGERIGPGWRETVRRKIGRLETCTHLMELLGPAVTTLYQTMSHQTPDGGDASEGQQHSGKRPFFIGGCHSWRTDGPVVAAIFPQFATKPAAKD